MVNVFNKKYSIQYGLVLLVAVSLACNVSINTKSAKPTATIAVPTEEVEIIPTKPVASATPTEEMVEVPTVEPPTGVIPTEVVVPSATKRVIRNTPTRTIPPPTATKIAVVRQSTQAATPTEVSSSDSDITVTAATGNLFVRRGPGTTYNIVSGFSKGVTTKAVGRNEKNNWLATEIPLAKGTVGWISLGTGYTELHGKLADLPLYPFDEPKPAYVQNCTLHDMTTRPGQWNLPAKTTQKVSPGEYQFLDMSTGQSKVMEATLKEGNTVYIKVDGDGASHSCP
jgi:hypothetical protein